MTLSTEQQQLIDRIRTSADAVRQAVARVPPARHAAPPREGEWSALETLIHLRNTVVMVHGLRIRRLFYETDPIFADYDEAAHRQASLEQGEAVPDLVDTIVAEHQQVARLLRHPARRALGATGPASRAGSDVDRGAGPPGGGARGGARRAARRDRPARVTRPARRARRKRRSCPTGG